MFWINVSLGGIEYTVEHLGVPLVAVLGHDSCGAGIHNDGCNGLCNITIEHALTASLITKRSVIPEQKSDLSRIHV